MFRRTALFLCLALTVLITAGWIATAINANWRYWRSFYEDPKCPQCSACTCVALSNGCLRIAWVNGPSQVFSVPQTETVLPFYERSPGYMWNLGIPLWMPAAACGVISLLLWRSIRRKRRRASGVCKRCGYDLTGLTAPRCPECGHGFELPEGQPESQPMPPC